MTSVRYIRGKIMRALFIKLTSSNISQPSASKRIGSAPRRISERGIWF